jgi:hypothetical protein
MDTIERLEQLGRVEPADPDVLNRTADALWALAAAESQGAGVHVSERSTMMTRSLRRTGLVGRSASAAVSRPRRYRRPGICIAAAAIVLLTGIFLSDTSLDRPPSAAAATLLQAAAAASSQPTLPLLGAGQYYYQANIEKQLCVWPLSSGTAVVNYLNLNTHENWVAGNGTGSVRLVADPGGRWLTSQDKAKWQAAGSPKNFCSLTTPLLPLGSDAAILALPTDPTVLGSLIAEGRVDDVGRILPAPGPCAQATTSPTQNDSACSIRGQFDVVNNLLTSPVAVNKLGAVFFHILSQLPGVELIGTRTDALGRSGTAVENPSSGDVLVLDPSTGNLLETQSLASAGNTLGVTSGTVIGSVTFGPVSVVHGLGTLPRVGQPLDQSKRDRRRNARGSDHRRSTAHRRP